MVSRNRLFSLFIILLIALFMLSACERPTPGRDEGDQTAETDSGTEAATDDPNVGGGTDGDTATEGQTDEATTDTPRTDETTGDEGAAAEGEEAGESGDATAGDAGSETGDTAGEEETGAEETAAETGGETGGETAEETGGEDAQEETSTDESTDAGEAAQQVETPGEHVVAAGENLYRIGLQYGVSWVTLANYNGLTNPNRLTVGQVLKIPGDDVVTPTPTPSPGTETIYTVKAGDNLYRIGLQYGISWVQIAEANGLVNPNRITVGDQLKIPVNTPGPSPQFTHTVQPGETLFKISLQYGVPWTSIATENNIKSPYVIYVGEMLKIPSS